MTHRVTMVKSRRGHGLVPLHKDFGTLEEAQAFRAGVNYWIEVENHCIPDSYVMADECIERVN